MPCTGGSPWQNLNRTREGGEERLMEHRQLFQGIWIAFIRVAQVCNAQGGNIAIEWPPAVGIGNVHPLPTSWLSTS
eukprot:12572853-Heterocapsa_arctica.AAC.1